MRVFVLPDSRSMRSRRKRGDFSFTSAALKVTFMIPVFAE